MHAAASRLNGFYPGLWGQKIPHLRFGAEFASKITEM
jgi:hypothetical protein